MKLEITSKNYRVSERLEQILSAKLKKLDKYFPDGDTPCKVVLTDLGRQSKMEISISYHGTYIRSEVTGDTMYYNIDTCLPKLERQLVKHREKLNKSHKLPEKPSEYEFVSEVEVEPVTIAKTKRFEVSCMTALEAAENMDMLGHDFYLFVNLETGNVESVYRRKDGTIGLLQPYKN
ncbi:MAG: ribosome-associated translation inhibitor RaiA [Corallococcus sp.]|nr:ribosome-associated translation inhibitor RaiA [Corallococcus sp.]MCM1359859.1 ribosome-associated translation inhibitor RaiA [Corallococcus sp.]MCM1395293.1 ribosome-associated translation inhibitor RaiA [Corallococcus sp.]